MNGAIRTVCFNDNELRDERKRMAVERCLRGKVDVVGLNEIHLNGQAAFVYRVG